MNLRQSWSTKYNPVSKKKKITKTKAMMPLCEVVNKFLCVVLLLKECSVIDYFFVCLRYISIKPDNRKLANGTNVLGLLINTLLKEGFRLVSTRVSASGDKSECYVFERIKSPQVLGINITPKSETTTMPAPSWK